MKGTEEDREKFRNRVKDALGERTQRDLERALHVSSGTLSRTFGGRKNVEVEFLQAIADDLGVDAASLVKGTSFAELLDPQAEPEAVVENGVGTHAEEPESLPPEPEAVADAAETEAAEQETDVEPQLEVEPMDVEPIDVDALDTSPTEPVVEPRVSGDDMRPRPGIGGRVMRFFASIFGG